MAKKIKSENKKPIHHKVGKNGRKVYKVIRKKPDLKSKNIEYTLIDVFAFCLFYEVGEK